MKNKSTMWFFYAIVICVLTHKGMSQPLNAHGTIKPYHLPTDEQQKYIKVLSDLNTILYDLVHWIPKGTLSHDVINFVNDRRLLSANKNKLTKDQFQLFCGNVTNAIGKTRQTLSFYDDIAKMLSQNLQDVQKLFTDLSNSSHKTESWDIRDPRIVGILPRDYRELCYGCYLFDKYHNFKPHPTNTAQPSIDEWNKSLSNMQYPPKSHNNNIGDVVTQWKYNLSQIERFLILFFLFDYSGIGVNTGGCHRNYTPEKPIQTFLANYDMLLGLINTMLYTLPIAKQIMTKNCDQLEKAVQQSLQSL